MQYYLFNFFIIFIYFLMGPVKKIGKASKKKKFIIKNCASFQIIKCEVLCMTKISPNWTKHTNEKWNATN